MVKSPFFFSAKIHTPIIWVTFFWASLCTLISEGKWVSTAHFCRNLKLLLVLTMNLLWCKNRSWNKFRSLKNNVPSMFWTDSNEGRILHCGLWYFLVCKHAFHYFEQSIDISQSLVQNLIRLILHQSLSLFSYSNLQNKNVSLETTNFDYIEINIIKIWQIYQRLPCVCVDLIISVAIKTRNIDVISTTASFEKKHR